MKFKGIVIGLFAVVTTTAGGSSILAPIQVLQGKPPGQVRWLVRLYDRSHSALGTLHLRITPQNGRSCLGEFGDRGYLIHIDQIEGLPKNFPISQAPVAVFEGNTVAVDLTGGI
jgi:hypothetical protein